jgi:hypothetical protein
MLLQDFGNPGRHVAMTEYEEGEIESAECLY